MPAFNRNACKVQVQLSYIPGSGPVGIVGPRHALILRHTLFSIPRPGRVQGLAAAVLCLLMAVACSPALNWRDVRPGDSGLGLLLPCKPDKADKVVPLGPQPVTMSMLGCDAGGATFAVAVANLGDAAVVPAVLAQWQTLTLANMQAIPETTAVRPLKVPGASVAPAPVLVLASGRRADGSVVQGQAAYFARGAQVVQGVMYAPVISAQAADTFFTSLHFD